MCRYTVNGYENRKLAALANCPDCDAIPDKSVWATCPHKIEYNCFVVDNCNEIGVIAEARFGDRDEARRWIARQKRSFRTG